MHILWWGGNICTVWEVGDTGLLFRIASEGRGRQGPWGTLGLTSTTGGGVEVLHMKQPLLGGQNAFNSPFGLGNGVVG
ncbi:hypothetical protein Tco_1006205 [Tanacetum coccineum]|uniref:Uncharacterized protein n=1 Tax=Tanacetum coccineum TaxID=301880 RepID=A0ABQ5FHB4_9ASTR